MMAEFEVIQVGGVIKWVLNFDDGQVILTPSDKENPLGLTMTVISKDGSSASITLYSEDTHNLFAKQSLMFERLASMHENIHDGAVNDRASG